MFCFAPCPHTNQVNMIIVTVLSFQASAAAILATSCIFSCMPNCVQSHAVFEWLPWMKLLETTWIGIVPTTWRVQIKMCLEWNENKSQNFDGISSAFLIIDFCTQQWIVVAPSHLFLFYQDVELFFWLICLSIFDCLTWYRSYRAKFVYHLDLLD